MEIRANKERTKAYREANPEKFTARDEKAKARIKAWYEANPKKVKAWEKVWETVWYDSSICTVTRPK